MSELIIVRKNMLRDVYNVKALHLAMGLSDHMITLCNINPVGAWMRRGVKDGEKRKIRSKKLSQNGKEDLSCGEKRSLGEEKKSGMNVEYI